VPVRVWSIALYLPICVGREAAEAAVLTQHFCEYKRRDLTKEWKFFLCHYDSTAEENRRADCRIIDRKRALKLVGATRDARIRAH